jgi:hypothetical protein
VFQDCDCVLEWHGRHQLAKVQHLRSAAGSASVWGLGTLSIEGCQIERLSFSEARVNGVDAEGHENEPKRACSTGHHGDSRRLPREEELRIANKTLDGVLTWMEPQRLDVHAGERTIEDALKDCKRALEDGGRWGDVREHRPRWHGVPDDVEPKSLRSFESACLRQVRPVVREGRQQVLICLVRGRELKGPSNDFLKLSSRRCSERRHRCVWKAAEASVSHEPVVRESYRLKIYAVRDP